MASLDSSVAKPRTSSKTLFGRKNGDAKILTALKPDTPELDVHRSNLQLQHVVGESPQLVDVALKMLDGLYEGNAEDPRYLRGDRGEAMRDVCKAQGSEYAATYGEVLPSSLVKLLTELKCVSGQRFYDLGSGTGKMVLLAWLLGFKATGIELARERCQASFKILGAALHGQAAKCSEGDASWGIQLVQGDVATVDFSDGDIVIANSPCYPKALMDAMAKTAERMRPGTHIVTVGGLDSDWLRRVGVIKLQTSWNSEGTEFIIQTVLTQQERASLSQKEQERDFRPRMPGDWRDKAKSATRAPSYRIRMLHTPNPMAILRASRPTLFGLSK